MSETIRRIVGILLLVVCLAACVLPALSAGSGHTHRYRSGDRLQWAITEIQPQENGKIRINEADAEELTELNGVGETLASLIVSERVLNGPFFFAEDLEAVRGIGPHTLEKFRRMIDLSQGEREE